MKKGVQIPLPEGMDFTREVVTNHAVGGGTGTAWAPSTQSPLALRQCSSPFPGIPHGGS